MENFIYLVFCINQKMKKKMFVSLLSQHDEKTNNVINFHWFISFFSYPHHASFMLEQRIRGATDTPAPCLSEQGSGSSGDTGGTAASYQLSRRVTLRIEDMTAEKNSQNVSGSNSFCAMRELNSKNWLTQLKCAICSCRCNISSSLVCVLFTFYCLECSDNKGTELNWIE